MYGVANSLIRRLQSVQNATARLITGAKRQKHITPVLRQLHWLPVCQRVRFKLACIMYKSLSGQPPPVPGRWCPATCWQRSASTSISLLQSMRHSIPWTQNSFGDRAFAVAGPKIWNNLLPELRHVDISFGQFRNMLNSYLFRFYSAMAHRDFLIIAP